MSKMSRFRKEVMWSSGKDDWETPDEIFDYFNRIFNFTLDVCATPENTKCEKYFTKEDNGLTKNWNNNVCWMNPPFTENKKWIRKAYLSSLKPNTIVVCLIPSRTGTSWFHEYCVHGDIIFVRGRIRFKGAKQSAPFDSMVVIFPKNWKEILNKGD